MSEIKEVDVDGFAVFAVTHGDRRAAAEQAGAVGQQTSVECAEHGGNVPPVLDATGNSLLGMKALEMFVARTGSVF